MELKKIAIITARSGSKGLLNKNILMLINKPLIAYTIEAALKSKTFEKVIVSTDSLEYKEIAEKYGAEVILRSKKLASDTATSFMVLEDIIEKTKEMSYDYFVLLQPTSPFRNEIHIKEAVEKYEKKFKNIDFLVSVCKSNKSSSMIKIIENDLLLKNYNLDYSNYRRQDGVEYYPNGAIFIGKSETYLDKKHFFGERSLAYIMSKEDSIDIDDRIDFELAIAIANKKEKSKILLNNIKNRIIEKQQLFFQKKEITLIGHSLFDYWDVKSLNGKKVNNLGIAGISTKQYIDLILEKKLISKIDGKVFIFSGTNDFVVEKWEKENTLKWINKIVAYLKKLNPNVKIYLLEVPRVVSRMDRSNKIIIELNNFLKDKLNNEVKFVELGKTFQDRYGNLKLEYTYDGLHFNDKGYSQLKKVLEKEV